MNKMISQFWRVVWECREMLSDLAFIRSEKRGHLILARGREISLTHRKVTIHDRALKSENQRLRG